MDLKKMAVGLAVAGASHGAGFSLAGAQTEPPTTTPPANETPAPAPDADGDTRPDRRNCDKDGDGQPDNAPSGATAEDAFFRT